MSRGRPRTTRWTDKDCKEQRSTEIRVDELKMLRRAPAFDAIAATARSIASVEKLMRDAVAELRSDVTMADIAPMLRLIRMGLVEHDLAAHANDDAAA